MRRKRSPQSPIVENRQALHDQHHAQTTRFSETGDSTTSRNGECSPKDPERLTTIKQNLLQRGDWATLCVTRPLKIEFTPVDERLNVGKRRRVTEEDRSRQAAPIKQITSPEFCHSRTKRQRAERGPKSSVLEDISIRIGKPKQQAKASRMENHMPSLSQESSEPMLLDREEADYLNQLPNTPTRLPLRHSNPCLNPFTPRRGSFSPFNLNSRMIASTRSPFLGNNNYTPVPDDSWPSSIPRFSSKLSTQGSAGSSVKRPGGIVNGFLGSTSGLTEPQSVRKFETKNHPRRVDTRAQFGSQQMFFHRSPEPQLPDIYGGQGEHPISTSPFQTASIVEDSRIAERALTRHFPVENGYQNSSDPAPASSRFSQRVGSPMSAIPETEQIYKSIESDDQRVRCPATGDSSETPESGKIGKTEVLRNHEPISDRTIPGNQVAKSQLNDSHKTSNYFQGPVIFGQRLDQQAAHIPKKEDSWMKFIFEPQTDSKDAHLEHLNIGMARNKHRTWDGEQYRRTDSSLLEEATGSCAADGEISSNRKSTVQTCKNTSLNNSNNSPILSSESPAFGSETDFLSNLSPMEGLLDEGLAQISVYNNAARAIRSPEALSMKSSSNWDSEPYPALQAREQSNPESVSPFSGQASNPNPSTQNQAPLSIQSQVLSSPDPLAMDNFHDRRERGAVRYIHREHKEGNPLGESYDLKAG